MLSVDSVGTQIKSCEKYWSFFVIKNPHNFPSFPRKFLEHAIHNSASSLTMTQTVYSLCFYHKCSLAQGVTNGLESHPVNTGNFFSGQSDLGVKLITQPPSKAEVKNEWTYSSTSPHDFVAWARTSALVIVDSWLLAA
jgi:hypothetical protein